tara:strand:- start:530 stop:790 length:261 start_codon:yes stop_codon:yes gene_type:complete
MAYSETLVLAGGIAHVPILITILKFADAKSAGIYQTKQASNQAKVKAEEAAKAKAAAATAAAAAKAAAKAKAKAAASESSSNTEGS